METTIMNNMCRCCASEGAFKDIKTTYRWMGEDEVYGDMLKDCFDITLSASDSESGICEVCITQLRNAANFKKQVLHTEEQFLKHGQNKLFKPNIVKVELPVEDVLDGDDNNLSGDDAFSGAEYELPIKTEKVEEPKTKKRAAAKASTSRSKKQKTSDGEDTPAKSVTRWSKKPALRKQVIIIEPREDRQIQLKKINEVHKHLHNVRTILLCSNATPIKRYGSIGYACAFCNKEFPEAVNLKNHTLETHDDNKIDFMENRAMPSFIVKLDITSLLCSLCNNHFENLDTLKEHLISVHKKFFHNDIKNHMVPFNFDYNLIKCVICKNEFNNFKVLLEHMNMHYRNYICEVCGKGFINKRILRIHTYRHKTGEFACTFCSKIFDTKVKQKEHERAIHLCLSKRSKCGYCGEKFTDYTKKNDHEVKVHGAKPIVLNCQACHRTFGNQRALTVHAKSYHMMERRASKKTS
ncbi:zinc finger protein 652 isoform X10 [Manduca sexta]|uniref:zinc finger protein 652 isoform X10 n=1 Tax=Manduca sexta TaxID=7130 RepID=UPI00188DF659|nr:zinc finger protein 652 isoform X10 [Manduca sexta]